MEEIFLNTIEKVKSIKESNTEFARMYTNSLDELISRLEVLSKDYESLEVLNKRYLELDPLRMDISLDSETGILTFKQGGIVVHSLKINRADPNVPVQLAGKSDVSSFTPASKEENEEFKSIKANLASELESFYYNASKTWDLIEKTLLVKKNSEFIGVKMVRNKLIEHTEHGDIFSFGASEEWGPSVKPTQLTNRKEKFHDKGLRTNTKELLEKITERLKAI